MKTPNVYIKEGIDFSLSIVEVSTAVPAFVGYTEKATDGKQSLINKPYRITSMAEFRACFGGPPKTTFSIMELPGNAANIPNFEYKTKKYSLTQDLGKYLLYYSMLLFFDNGGGPCYIVSIGDYSEEITSEAIKRGIDELIKEQEPTMLLIPETTLLPNADASADVQRAMLNHCGCKMKNRIAILDLYKKDKNRNNTSETELQDFRNKIGEDFLDFGVAYYPWLNTSIVPFDILGYQNITNKNVLQDILKEELLSDGVKETSEKDDLLAKIAKINEVNLKDNDQKFLNKTLIATSAVFCSIISSMKASLNLLPPGAAMAGVYNVVDNMRGVWKAPANISLKSVVSPAINITTEEQENMNVSLDGKSINAIRYFPGEGTLVWGARTLDGNSNDWRYINVRRAMIMLEGSIKNSTKAYVFQPNEATTWNAIKSMITDFLTGIWKRGGLAGPTPDDAFRVQVGLGETMIPEDILNGILRVKVLVAPVRPANFLEITFQQQMQ